MQLGWEVTCSVLDRVHLSGQVDGRVEGRDEETFEESKSQISDDEDDH